MELMQCFKQECKHMVEYTCQCTSPETLSCEKHFGKHMKIPDKAHVFERIIAEPYKGTKEAILRFLAREESKNSKLKEKILVTFSQRLLESENDCRELLKHLDSDSAEISSYFTKISQTRKFLKSVHDPILVLLSLHPDEAIKRLKKIIPTRREWYSSAKLFLGFREKIEKIIGCFIEDKFEAYLDRRLSSIEKTLQDHNKVINLANDELANIKDSISELIDENKNSKKDLDNWKEEIKLKTENEIDLLNTQIAKITQDFNKNNEAEGAQKILQELREKRSEILDRPNNPEIEQHFRKMYSICGSDTCIYDRSLQQAYQDYANAYRIKTSLYTVEKDSHNTTKFIIYDTENDSKEVRMIEIPELDNGTCIAQLPNGHLFCFGNYSVSGSALIIDENYRVRELPSGTPCRYSSAIYFDNNVYCFGGCCDKYLLPEILTLSERFNLNENRWIQLTPLLLPDCYCNSIIFNGNILISGYENCYLSRYSIESDTLTIVPYNFTASKNKILINADRAYLIECGKGSVYESEVSNDDVWCAIASSIISDYFDQVYFSYNKGGINIVHSYRNDTKYYKFNLNEKILTALTHK